MTPALLRGLTCVRTNPAIDVTSTLSRRRAAEIAAEMIVPGSGHYSAAKAGTNMLTRTFAQELGPRIRVNCVMPGAVPTEIMMKAMNLKEEDLPGLEQMLRLPAGRLGTPEDLGATVLYFASKATEWVTGQCVRVSGGP